VVIPSDVERPRFEKTIFADARKNLWRLLELDVYRRWKTQELNRNVAEKDPLDLQEV